MIVTLTTLSGEEKKLTTVDGYESLSTKAFQNIFKDYDEVAKPIEERDYWKLWCTVNDLKAGYKEQDEDAEGLKGVVWKTIRWYFETPSPLDTEVPKVLQIGDKIIELPEELQLLTVGQNIALRQALEGKKYIQENISIALAIYLQPIYDNTNLAPGEKKVRFDMKRVRELEKLIDEMPITLTGPAGFFLLQNALNSGRSSGKRWPQILLNLVRKLNRMLRRWLTFNGYNRSTTYS